VGKRTTRIAVTVFESDIVPGIKSLIETVLGAQLPGRNISIHSHVRTTMAVLHERSEDVHGYVIANVGAEASYIVAVRKDELSDYLTLPIGIASVVRHIAGEKGLPAQIPSLLRMAAAESCHDPACEEVKAGLARFEPELVKTFGEAFATLARARRLPNECVLIAHADFAPWLEHFLTRIDFAPFTITMQPLNVETLIPLHLRTFVRWEAGVSEDTGNGIGSAYTAIT
jgi:hypothetical protein